MGFASKRWIALTANIEKVLHQIEVREYDRGLLRFLWNDDVSSDARSIVKFRLKTPSIWLNPKSGTFRGDNSETRKLIKRKSPASGKYARASISR